MNNNEKMLKLTQAMAEKTVKDKADKDAVLTEYKNKEKTKALTTSERLDRLEQFIGVF
jgi:hypothetical protein